MLVISSFLSLWICKLIFFTERGKFQPLFLQAFFPPIPFSPLLLGAQLHVVRRLDIIPYVTEALLPFSMFFSFLRMVSIDMSSSSLMFYSPSSFTFIQ